MYLSPQGSSHGNILGVEVVGKAWAWEDRRVRCNGDAGGGGTLCQPSFSSSSCPLYVQNASSGWAGLVSRGAGLLVLQDSEA